MIYLLISFCIVEIGANTGGNRGVKFGGNKFKNNNKQHIVSKKDVFIDICLIGVSIASVILDVYYIKCNKSVVDTIITILLAIVVIVISVQDLKEYKKIK